ncbi:MAG TPA: Tm-1-like ATP-binding domain-containing protein, partial [Candidatus Methylomirabilis sp.]
LDLTPHELGEEVMGDGAYTPVRPGRMTAAGRRGIPQVVSTGGMEYLCFGPPETVPAKYRGRPCAMHNPLNPNIRLTAGELAQVGRVMAERLSAARGPAAVLVPLRGWSAYGGPGGPLHDPEADAALVRALAQHLDPRIPVRRLDLHINDPAFADACVDTLLAMLTARTEVTGLRTG